jgi:H+-transporting ATPase
MTVDQISSDSAQQQSIEQLYTALSTSPRGLSTDEAQERLAQSGPNALEEEKVNPILKFLSYFWGPIPWMIEIAAVLSALVKNWVDLIIILVLLAFNAVVGFWQEYQAANAVEALKKQLALKAGVKRNGEWQEVDAVILAPGGILRLRLGDILPADA